MDRALPSRLAAAAASGVFAGSLAHGLSLVPSPWVAPVALGFALAAVSGKRRLACASLLGFALAFFVFDSHLADLEGSGPWPEGERVASGKAISVSDRGATVRVLAGEVSVRSGEGEVPMPGRVQVDFERGVAVEAGDAIETVCRFREAEPPIVTRDRAVRDRIVAVCASPRILSISPAPGGVMRAVTAAREALVLAIGRALPSPHSDLGAGLILGSAATPLPREVADRFRSTGTSHIVAASGYNVSVIAVWCLAATVGIGFRRRTALVSGVALVWVYVAMAGFSPAVVRAGVMGSMAAMAGAIGREARPLHALAVSAAAMLAFAPELLLFDVGFELTVAATAGLVVVGPVLSEKYPRMFSGGTVRKLLAETVAATVSTLPVILWRFGTLSPVAVFANLLIVPMIPVAMMLSAAAAVLGLVGPPAVTLGLVAWAPLEYLLRVSDLLSRLPAASVQVGAFPWWGMAIAYASLALWLAPRPIPAAGEPLREHEGWTVESSSGL